MGNSPTVPYQPLVNENDKKSDQSSKNSNNTYGSSTQDTKPLLKDNTRNDKYKR